MLPRASWTFVLCDAGGNALAELSTASGRSISFKRNSYSEVTLSLSHEDDAAGLLLSALATTGVPRLKAYRLSPVTDPSTQTQQPAVLRFRGPLVGLQESSEETSMLTCTFRSPFAVLVGDGDKSGRFLTSQFPTIYTGADAGFIASDLANIANRDSPTGLATDPNLIVATTARNATYPVGQNIGSAIGTLSAVLDGYDFYETFVDTGTVTHTPGPGAPELFGPFTDPFHPWTGVAGFYYYMVTAIVGGIESAPSNEGGRPVTNPGPGATPSWSPVPGATAYNIYRSTISGGETVSPAFLTSVGSGTLSFTDTGAATSAGAISGASVTPAWNPDAFLNIVPAMGQAKPNARFEYGPTTISNVASMSRTTTNPLNTLFVTGGNGLTSTYSDVTSVAKYGKWWGHYDFPDVIDQAILDAKARALCRPNPVKTLTMVPELGLDNCPKPFDDFGIGDTVPFFASRGALQENTTLRINGYTIPISEDGLESVSVDDPTQPSDDAVTMAQLTAEVDVT
jgi:hypothetical protein